MLKIAKILILKFVLALCGNTYIYFTTMLIIKIILISGGLDPMSKEDFDAYRKEAENTFRAVYNILEQQFVHILWTSLQQHGDKWQTAESIYFALLTAAERISPTEPAIAQFCNWALQNNSRDNIFLSTTIVRFLGKSCSFQKANPTESLFF
jgi:hypothetical protein